MKPGAYYQKQCEKGLVVEDQQQKRVLLYLDELQQQLIKEQQKRSSVLNFLRKPKLIPGLYVWGGVGIGKTFMMDCFYHCLPFHEKKRMHFHQFMRMVHKELKQHQGEKNPLQVIAKNIALKTMVLCFDEFIVSDIVDAMLLARLLKALFAHGVCLVTTSNTKPDDLYKRGLQRPLFLPAIDMLKKHTTVMHVSSEQDYRLRHLKMAGVFYSPDDTVAQDKMKQSFSLLVAHGVPSVKSIEINGRSIPVIKQVGNVVWFDFNVICAVPRSQLDYLAIAEQFKTVFISHVPIIQPAAHDTILLFIRLIDVLYDAHVRLFMSSQVKVDQLYTNGRMLDDYARTRSRLLEMQSEQYFL